MKKSVSVQYFKLKQATNKSDLFKYLTGQNCFYELFINNIFV